MSSRIIKPLLIIFLFIPLSTLAQKVENLRFEQIGKQIILYYDLTGTSTSETYDIQVYCSTDGGKTLGFPLKHITGDAGTNIPGGIGKNVFWDVLNEREQLEGNILFEIQIKSTKVANVLSIGQSYQGGIIAYILQLGDPGYIAGETHGLIAAPSNQSKGIQWHNRSRTIVGATSISLGTGKVNTNKIVTSLGDGSYAAKLCFDLVLNGYNDWYLPSKDELDKLYLSKSVIGGFAKSYYWSSSEYDTKFAWDQKFSGSGKTYDSSKGTKLYVRAVRAF